MRHCFTGIGLGISNGGLICVLGFYFDKWRNQILSCAFLMVGVAMFVSAPFGLYLISNYGLAMTLSVCGCMQAQLIVIGMICKPSNLEKEVKQKKKKTLELKQESKANTYIDFSLMKRKPFLMFLLSTSAWNFALCVAVVHLPNYISILGGSQSDIALLMTAFSIANIIGRLLGSLTVSKLYTKCLYIHVSVLGLSGAVTSLFIFYSRVYGGTVLFTVQLGIFTGWPNSMMTPLSVGFVGVSKLSEAYGLAYLFCGFGVSAGPVLISM